MVKTLKILISFWRRLQIFIVTVIFLLFCPLIILFFTPIYMIRYIVSKTHTIVHPQEGKILSTKSAVFASDSIYFKPKCTLLVMFVFDGNMELSKLRDNFLQFISKTNSSSGRQQYPELQQYIKRWMGFYFWHRVPQFNLENYITLYKGQLENELITEENMPKLVNELTSKPFDKEQSPWEGIVIHNTNVETYQNYSWKRKQQNIYLIHKINNDFDFEAKDIDNDNINDTAFTEKLESNDTEYKFNLRDDEDEHQTNNKNKKQSVIFFRIHHALADGISIRALLMDFVGYPLKNLVSLDGKQKEKISCRKIIEVLSYPFRAPFETIGALLDSYDKNEWHLPENKLSGQLRGATTKPVSVDFIKEVKNSYGVTFATVVLAAVSGGIRNFMVERDIRVPKGIHCLTPLPMPGHTAKLRNHLTAAAIELPLGIASPTARLAQIHKNLIHLKKSVVPQTNYLFYPILGGLFPFITNRLFRHDFTTALLSSFQGPDEKIQLLGHSIEDMAFAGGLLMGRLGIGITLLSYNGKFRVLVGVDKSIIPTYKDAHYLATKIHEEFFILSDLQIV